MSISVFSHQIGFCSLVEFTNTSVYFYNLHCTFCCFSVHITNSVNPCCQEETCLTVNYEPPLLLLSSNLEWTIVIHLTLPNRLMWNQLWICVMHILFNLPRVLTTYWSWKATLFNKPSLIIYSLWKVTVMKNCCWIYR